MIFELPFNLKFSFFTSLQNLFLAAMIQNVRPILIFSQYIQCCVGLDLFIIAYVVAYAALASAVASAVAYKFLELSIGAFSFCLL